MYLNLPPSHLNRSLKRCEWIKIDEKRVVRNSIFILFERLVSETCFIVWLQNFILHNDIRQRTYTIIMKVYKLIFFAI